MNRISASWGQSCARGLQRMLGHALVQTSNPFSCQNCRIAELFSWKTLMGSDKDMMTSGTSFIPYLSSLIPYPTLYDKMELFKCHALLHHSCPWFITVSYQESRVKIRESRLKSRRLGVRSDGDFGMCRGTTHCKGQRCKLDLYF